MAYELRDNSGSLFLNSKKEKETHPDRTGTAMIDGVTYYVSGWLKKSQGGQQFLSLAFKRKDDQPRQESITERATAKIRRPDDPISSGLPPKRSILPDDDPIPFAPEGR
jgi:hypothetical protein